MNSVQYIESIYNHIHIYIYVCMYLFIYLSLLRNNNQKVFGWHSHPNINYLVVTCLGREWARYQPELSHSQIHLVWP